MTGPEKMIGPMQVPDAHLNAVKTLVSAEYGDRARDQEEAGVAGDRRSAERAPAIELIDITKRFPGVLANDAGQPDLACTASELLASANQAGDTRSMPL